MYMSMVNENYPYASMVAPKVFRLSSILLWRVTSSLVSRVDNNHLTQFMFNYKGNPQPLSRALKNFQLPSSILGTDQSAPNHNPT